MENALTKLFEVYPQMRKEKGYTLEIMLEVENNGQEAGYELFLKRIRNGFEQ